MMMLGYTVIVVWCCFNPVLFDTTLIHPKAFSDFTDRENVATGMSYLLYIADIAISRLHVLQSTDLAIHNMMNRSVALTPLAVIM